jgi:hypothetical protein
MNDEDAKYYSGRSDALFSTEIAIMVLDENFSILSETKLPKNRYIHWDFFVLENGLYISANNPNHPSFNENNLIYHHFEFVEMYFFLKPKNLSNSYPYNCRFESNKNNPALFNVSCQISLA